MFSTRTFLVASTLLAILLFTSCKENSKSIQWYFWKQDFKLNTAQKELLDTLNTNKIYVKYFDVDFEYKTAKPLAMVQFSSTPKDVEIIPCIYITNRTFNAPNYDSESDAYILAKKIFNLVKEIGDKNRVKPYQEIQFDCDWTVSTKDSYFNFLQAYKELVREDVLVTSTLRLHQLKYPKETGVPPVDKVCLMVYNVGNIKDPNETNSIFKPSIVQDYIQPSSVYPLPMDIALPVYSWAVLYRFEKLSLILNNMTATKLGKNEWLQEEGDKTFRSTKNHYFEGNYLYKDDLIRLEEINMDSLQAVIPLFKGINSQQTQLILFELSNENSLNYTYEDFENIRDSFY